MTLWPSVQVRPCRFSHALVCNIAETANAFGEVLSDAGQCQGFRYLEVDLGICPAVVAPWLIQKIGAGKARNMLLAGGTMNGEEALAYGLVDECVPFEALDEAVERRIKRILAGGPNAIRVTKEWLNELEGDKIRQDVLKGGQLSASIIQGEEAQSRIRSLWKD